MASESKPIQQQRIVIVRPSALGDVCRSVPVLASIRKALPHAHIAWVVQDDFAPAIEAHPALNEVIAFPRSRFGKWWRSPRQAIEVKRWFRELRDRRFDVAIDCQGLSRSGLIVRATRAPMRIGLRSAREFAWVCYNRRVPTGDEPEPVHTVDRMLSLLEPLGIPAVPDMRLYAPAAAVNWWREQRQSLGMNDGQPTAVIAPGSRWLSKRWPIERFTDIVEPLLKRGFARVIVIGSRSEREQMTPLLDKAAKVGGLIVDLVGQTSIAQTMAIIADAGLVIANDSAPLHMAVGFDRPCVALFGPTDPAAVGPYARAESVIRAYQPGSGGPGADVTYKDDRIGDSLMRLISTALVLQTLDRILALWPQRSRSAQTAPMAVQTGAAASRGSSGLQEIVAMPRGLNPKAAP